MKTSFCISIMTALVLLSSCNKAPNYCNQLAELQMIPFKGEHVNDQIYNGLISEGDKNVCCLINKLTDTTKTNDPRQTPPYNNIAIADKALFILIDIAKEDIMHFLPDEQRREFNIDGVYAYFKYVKRYENRQEIQKKWLEWYLINRKDKCKIL